jgi:flagellar biogenesis protein FliO
MKIAELFASEQMTNALVRAIRVLLVILAMAWVVHTLGP